MQFRAGTPVLRAHNVNDLQDRVNLIRRMLWDGEAAFDKRMPPIGGLKDAQMRQIGLRVTQPCRARNDMCELQAIFDFITGTAPDGMPNVRYTGDIYNKDTFQSPLRTLQYRGGDCDDHVALNSLLANENGFQTKARITSNTGATWDHIFCIAGVPKHRPTRWVVLDTTLGAGRFNRHPPYAKLKDFDLSEPRR